MFKTLKNEIRQIQGIFYLCVFSADFLLTNEAGKFKWENYDYQDLSKKIVFRIDSSFFRVLRTDSWKENI